MIKRVRLAAEVRRRPSEVFRKSDGSSQAPSAARGDQALCAIFVVMIGLPLAGLVLGIDRSFVLDENRTLAAQPALEPDRKALAALPTKLEAYFNDHFGFRKRLIYWLALAKVKGLGVTSARDVTLGRDGWLYFASDAAVASFRHTRPFTSAQLEEYRQTIEARRDWLASRGVPYVLIVAPNKDTIYPEFMPGAYTKVNPTPRLDQLTQFMKERSNVPILDVREDLLRNKRIGLVFDVTDSHWNARGGYIAYARIMNAICKRYPQAQALPRSAFQDVVEPGPGGDLAQMLGIADRFPEERLKLEPWERWHFSFSKQPVAIAAGTAYPELAMVTECPGAKLPRAVLFRDSFAAQLIPFLAEHFERMVCIWDRNFNRAICEEERPSVVIQEIVERSLEGEVPRS